MCLAAATSLWAMSAGCGPKGAPRLTSPPQTHNFPTVQKTPDLSPTADTVKFTDITEKSGIKFTHFSGARGKLYFPESECPGCAFFDYNNDGWPDILITNGMDWRDWKGNRSQTRMKLFRNNRGESFTDVTREAGLDVEMHGMGIGAADYDNDGWQDLYITCALGPSRLFHNDHGVFRDVTREAGVDDKSRWGTSALWFDYDNDGRLDLLVCNYCKWTPETDVFCSAHGNKKTYCTPNVYDGEPVCLYRNNGNGTFTDVTKKAGLVNPAGKTWSAALLDFNNDGKMDIALANDMEPTSLFRNNGDGTFTDVAMESGVALGENGIAKAGMGIDAADMDNSGRESILTGNFSGEGLSLFHNPDGSIFNEKSLALGMSDTSMLFMSWGAFFFDYDLDGQKDALIANGHLYAGIEKFQPDISYAERPLLYHNAGGSRFDEVGIGKGALNQKVVARGSSYADIDGDGDLDVLIVTNGGKPLLLRNDGGNKNNWLRVRLEGKRSNRDGIGAKIEAKSGSIHQMYRVRSGSGFMSTLERTVTLGLGRESRVDVLRITWPSGTVDLFKDVPSGQEVTISEGGALTRFVRKSSAH